MWLPLNCCIFAEFLYISSVSFSISTASDLCLDGLQNANYMLRGISSMEGQQLEGPKEHVAAFKL